MWSFQNLLFIISSAVSSAAGLIHVFGYEGRDLKMSCPYKEGYEEYEKYLCKNPCRNRDVLIKTSQIKNKYFIYDDKTARIFIVNISNLNFHDAGKYWCGVTRTGNDIYTEVKLEVSEDRCCEAVNKFHSIEESSTSISCPYDSEFVNKLKYICRGNQPSTCLQQALITSNSGQIGRFRLTNDRKSRTFTLTISSLTMEDSGSYLCGVQRKTRLDVFSAVDLEVKELESLNISGIVGHPVTFHCPNSEHHNKTKFLCKGEQDNCTEMIENQRKFLLHNVSSCCFSVTIADLEAADTGTYYCGSDSQLSYIKIQLAVGEMSKVFLHQTSSMDPISTAKELKSLPPSSHVHGVNLTLIFSSVLVLLFILTFVFLMVLKYKSRTKQVNGVRENELNSADTDVEIRNNDIYELQQDVVYMNSSTPNILNNDDGIYDNTLYRRRDQ